MLHILLMYVFVVSPGHYGKENLRGQDMHNFISSGFVTLGRGHLKGKVPPPGPFIAHKQRQQLLSQLSGSL